MSFAGIDITKTHLAYMRANTNKAFRSGVFVDDV